MKLNEQEGFNLPLKHEENYKNIDFSKLFSQDFEKIKKYELDIMGLEEIVDEKIYSNKLFLLNKDLDKKQIVLEINSNIPEPICLIYKLKEDNTLFTNSIKIKIKKNVKASIIEVFTNTSQNSAFFVNRTFDLEENSNLEYAKIQDFKEDNFFIYNNLIEQKDNSKCKITSFELGDSFCVNNYINKFENKNSIYKLDILVKNKNKALSNNLIYTQHNNKACESNINIKHSLDENSKAVFKAKTIVNKNAIFSKAFQNSNTILLSEDATIFAQPHLEILIDELEASHGATCGSLDEEQLLYLQARGINKNKARQMLLFAFEKEIFDKIEDKLIKEFIASYKRKDYV